MPSIPQYKDALIKGLEAEIIGFEAEVKRLETENTSLKAEVKRLLECIEDIDFIIILTKHYRHCRRKVTNHSSGS